MPAIHALQLDDEDRPAWINYSALDAKATWELHAVLRLHLREKNASGWQRTARHAALPWLLALGTVSAAWHHVIMAAVVAPPVIW